MKTNAMTKEFHYYYQDAQNAANEFAKEHNGTCVDTSATERTLQGCSYMDEQADNLCWSGEVSAIAVEDNKTFETLAIFAYWE